MAEIEFSSHMNPPEVVGEVNPRVFEKIAGQNQAEQPEATPDGIIGAKDLGSEFTTFDPTIDPTIDRVWEAPSTSLVRPGPSQIDAALGYMAEVVKDSLADPENRFAAARYILDMEMMARD